MIGVQGTSGAGASQPVPANGSGSGSVRVPVVLSSKQAKPAEEAAALLKSLKYSERRITAYNQEHGGDLRQTLTNGLTRNQQTGRINHDAYTKNKDGTITAYIKMDQATYQRLTQFKAERARSLVEQRAQRGAQGVSKGEPHVKVQTMQADTALRRHRLEVSQRTHEARQQIVEGVLGTSGAQIAGATLARTLPTAAPLGAAEALPVAIGAAGVLGTAAVLDKRLELMVERQMNATRHMPPVAMSKGQDEPRATDTAERPTQPEIKVGPDETSLASARPSTPSASQPTVSQPPAPHPSTPQGEPPRPKPPLDAARGIPTAITTAALGKLAADVTKPAESLAVHDNRARAARGVPDVDYKGRAYSAAQKDHIYKLGDDPKRGFLLEEGESGFAAERQHKLNLSRYNQEGLEFKDRAGAYWDVVSPRSYDETGRPVFNEKAVLKAITRHFLKGNVILDHGQLNEQDADILRKSVDAFSEADRRGRKIIFVRNGE